MQSNTHVESLELMHAMKHQASRSSPHTWNAIVRKVDKDSPEAISLGLPLGSANSLQATNHVLVVL
jgi:hypothetical protein